MPSERRDVEKEAIDVEFWNSAVEAVNAIRHMLNSKPSRLRFGHHLSPGGILNAYREGDLSFIEAVDAIDKLVKLRELTNAQR